MKRLYSILALLAVMMFSLPNANAVDSINDVEFSEGNDYIQPGRGWYIGYVKGQGVFSYLWFKIPAGATTVQVNYTLQLPDNTELTTSSTASVTGREWWDDNDKIFSMQSFQEGNYTLTAQADYTVGDETVPYKVVGKFNYNGTSFSGGHVGGGDDPIETPEGNAINYELIPTFKGCDFKYNITSSEYNLEDVKEVLVCLMHWGEPFSTETPWHSTTLEGTIATEFDGEAENVWMKAQFVMNDGTTVNCDPWDTVITLNKKKESFDINLGIAGIGTFERTSATSGKLQYQITPGGPDIELIDHYIVFASRAGNEDMGRHQTTDVTGTITLDDLPNNETTNVWLKVQAVSVNGTVSSVFQANPVACSTSSSLSAYILTGFFEAIPTAKGADYKFKAVAAACSGFTPEDIERMDFILLPTPIADASFEDAVERAVAKTTLVASDLSLNADNHVEFDVVLKSEFAEESVQYFLYGMAYFTEDRGQARIEPYGQACPLTRDINAVIDVPGFSFPENGIKGDDDVIRFDINQGDELSVTWDYESKGKVTYTLLNANINKYIQENGTLGNEPFSFLLTDEKLTFSNVGNFVAEFSGYDMAEEVVATAKIDVQVKATEEELTGARNLTFDFTSHHYGLPLNESAALEHEFTFTDTQGLNVTVPCKELGNQVIFTEDAEGTHLALLPGAEIHFSVANHATTFTYAKLTGENVDNLEIKYQGDFKPFSSGEHNIMRSRFFEIHFRDAQPAALKGKRIVTDQNAARIKTLSLTTDLETGVESIANDTANRIIFDLDGRRINGENLRPGIYVVRQGNTCSKILVK